MSVQERAEAISVAEEQCKANRQRDSVSHLSYLQALLPFLARRTSVAEADGDGDDGDGEAE